MDAVAYGENGAVKLDDDVATTYEELVDVVVARLTDDATRPDWAGPVTGVGTINAFIRRLRSSLRPLRPVIRADLTGTPRRRQGFVSCPPPNTVTALVGIRASFGPVRVTLGWPQVSMRILCRWVRLVAIWRRPDPLGGCRWSPQPIQPTCHSSTLAPATLPMTLVGPAQTRPGWPQGRFSAWLRLWTTPHLRSPASK